MYLNHGVEVEEEVELRDYPKGSQNHRSLDPFPELLIASVWSGGFGFLRSVPSAAVLGPHLENDLPCS